MTARSRFMWRAPIERPAICRRRPATDGQRISFVGIGDSEPPWRDVARDGLAPWPRVSFPTMSQTGQLMVCEDHLVRCRSPGFKATRTAPHGSEFVTRGLKCSF